VKLYDKNSANDIALWGESQFIKDDFCYLKDDLSISFAFLLSRAEAQSK
jgi:hypothetical protein